MYTPIYGLLRLAINRVPVLTLSVGLLAVLTAACGPVEESTPTVALPTTATGPESASTPSVSPTPADTVITSEGLPTTDPTEPSVSDPTPTPTSLPLPEELTKGVNALVDCAGQDADYWLEHGPPKMNAELVACLNAYLEAN